MYITIDRNNRGNLEISPRVIDVVAKNIIAATLGNKVKEIAINSSISHDDLLFLVVKLTLNPDERELFNDRKLVKEIEKAFFQTLEFKPKNIAIAYYK